jgi:hypothetical protein
MFRRLCIVLLGIFVAAACQQEAPVPLGTGQQAVILGPGPGGVFTGNCEAACNAADTICGTVQDPADPQLTCCCIGGCPEWGPTCAAGVANGTIGPGQSPVGGGVFTDACEQACNASNTTCGTVANAANQTCCCVGSCPQWAPTCAAGVAAGTIGPGGVLQANGLNVLGAAGGSGAPPVDPPAPVPPPVPSGDPSCVNGVITQIAAAITELSAALPCDGGEPECVPQVAIDLLIDLQPFLIEEVCAPPAPPPPAAQVVVLQPAPAPAPRPRILLRSEFEAIAIYIGKLDTAIFNRLDDPKTTDLAAAESKALQDKMREILKVMKDEVDGRRGGPRLNDGDAKTWFGDLSKSAGALKDALDKVAADVNQPKATRDAARERAGRVKNWIDKLDVIKAGGSFGTLDLVVP